MIVVVDVLFATVDVGCATADVGRTVVGVGSTLAVDGVATREGVGVVAGVVGEPPEQ